MSGRGFFHKNVKTPLCEHYAAAGALFSLTTNSEQLLEAARTTFLPVISAQASVDFSLRFWVDDADTAGPPWPRPYARGLGHLVFAGFDTRSSLLANLRTRRVSGRFSTGMATDTQHWKLVIFPILLSILAGSVGLVELHASCVASGELGLLLLGPSLCGKSTLAMALTKAGFRFLSDDRTFCFVRNGKLAAWGLSRPLKLRRDSGAWFDDFRDRETTHLQNGDRVFHFDPGLQRVSQCEPRLLIFLERVNGTAFEITPMTYSQARFRVEQDLLAEFPEALRMQEETLEQLLSLPKVTLRYGGSPQQVAEQLAAFFDKNPMTITRDNVKTTAEDMAEFSPQGDSTPLRGNRQADRPDLLRRFAPAPHTADVQLLERTVRLEASTTAVLELVRSFFRQYQLGKAGKPQFLWRIVCESDPRVESTAALLSAFSDPGLRYVNIGQRGFLGVDLEGREAAAFLSDQFMKRDARFRHRPPLDILFCMTAPSLGLTALSGGCVGINDRGALIFGPPNSGKTTACYLAARCGMEFHADQVVFLDMKTNVLRAWGDPFPAVFRPEGTRFLPELQRTARYSTYEDFEFYYFDKSPFQAQLARPVTPVCGLFLNRNTTSGKELKRIAGAEILSQLHECLLFDEDERFEAQITAALSALAAIPIYSLRYGEDPKIAAGVIKKLLL